MFVSGNFTNNGGAFNAGTGLVMFTGSTTQTITGTTPTSFYDFDLNDGLLGYWKFDEGSGLVAKDSSGNGFNGSLTTDLVYGPEYVTTIPSAIAFSDPYAISMTASLAAWVDMGDLSQFMNLGDFTISQWVLLNDVNSGSPNDWATPLGKGTYNGHGWLVLFNRSTNPGAHVINLYLNPDPYPGSPNVAATIPTPSGGWVAGQWYHYAFTRSGSTIRGYLNGVQQVVATDSTVPGTNTSPLAIGRTSAGTYHWDGQIDDTRIYTRGLAATEIQALASGYLPNSSINTVTLGAPITVSHQLRLNSGTLDASAGNYAIALQGDLERNGGIFTPSGGTVTFDGSGVQNLTTDVFTFNNVTVGIRRHAGDRSRCDSNECIEQQRRHPRNESRQWHEKRSVSVWPTSRSHQRCKAAYQLWKYCAAIKIIPIPLARPDMEWAGAAIGRSRRIPARMAPSAPHSRCRRIV